MGSDCKVLERRCDASKSFEPVFLCASPAGADDQAVFLHLPGEQIGPRLLDVQQLLQLRIAHFAVLRQIVQHGLHLRGDRSGGLCGCFLLASGSGGVHVGQDQFECVRRHFDARLRGAILIERIDFANARAVGFDQLQAMENFRQPAVAGLRNAAADILGRKPGQQAADGNKFHAGVVDIGQAR